MYNAMTAEVSPLSSPAAALDSPRIKLLAIGDVGVGKSCVIKRYCEGRFVTKYIPTIGIDFGVKKVEVNKAAVLQRRSGSSAGASGGGGSNSSSSSSIPAAVRVNFWDGSGDDDYREIRNEFYDAAQGILLFYDVRDARSFENLQTWWDELGTYCEGLAAREKNAAPDGKRQSVTPMTVTGNTAAGKAVGNNEGKAPIVVLCANKADDTVVGGTGSAARETRVVTEEQGRAWAKAHGCAGYYETSASTEKNVKEAVEDLVTQVVATFM
ncbi:ras family protein-like protein [Leptomonas pyrrhocoris]|uniref:Ras family protein-like protein n=1 Tax=Leptomonas pyrrhocoris TaxID=157538 RepID=A0A0M9FWN4_LEPPY|nr:ras family protein-like protein [Leptomonas pyrrhocoris]XP_015656035.1 ras family protein-like protein [Leptomonas pyrrhocoris]KPA77595.1 ras family protein-like protein [Leptomonas pyrrhocoris]KPA77596.1 ras family protein-like protein [Leptomonas pyrrhocoris]|eukprot:XP_015656034.1 ras family protein-like protein [Leptomonas pyrrhocoris]